MTVRPSSTTLVVRLWLGESSPDDEAAWRGQIEHVSSGRITHFDSYDRLCDAFRQLAAWSVEREADGGPPRER